MNYKKQYDKLIETRRTMQRIKIKYDGLERHHIIPKSLGGNNTKANLIYLTPREHFIAHLLLSKMFTGKIKAKMCFALQKMLMNNKTQQRHFNSRQFEQAKLAVLQNCGGNNHPCFGRHHTIETKQILSTMKKGELNPMFGVEPWNKGLSKDDNQLLKEKADRWHENRQNGKYDHLYQGFEHTEEAKQKISLTHKGKPKSEEHRLKLSACQMGRKRDPEAVARSVAKRKGQILPLYICPHCNKEGRGSGMFQWHFDRCKHKPV